MSVAEEACGCAGPCAKCAGTRECAHCGETFALMVDLGPTPELSRDDERRFCTVGCERASAGYDYEEDAQ